MVGWMVNVEVDGRLVREGGVRWMVEVEVESGCIVKEVGSRWRCGHEDGGGVEPSCGK